MFALCLGLGAVFALMLGVLIASAYQVDAERRRAGGPPRAKP